MIELFEYIQLNNVLLVGPGSMLILVRNTFFQSSQSIFLLLLFAILGPKSRP